MSLYFEIKDQAMTSNLSVFEEIPQYVYWIYSP